MAEERAQREAAVAETDDTLRIARSLLVQSEQISDQISTGAAPPSPGRCSSAPIRWSAPTCGSGRSATCRGTSRRWRPRPPTPWSRSSANGTPLRLLLVALAIGVRSHSISGVGTSPRRSATARPRPVPRSARQGAGRVAGLPHRGGPGGARQLRRRLTVDVTNVMPARLLTVFHSLLGAFAFVAVVEAMADALLSPGRPAWRLIAMEDATAERNQPPRGRDRGRHHGRAHHRGPQRRHLGRPAGDDRHQGPVRPGGGGGAGDRPAPLRRPGRDRGGLPRPLRRGGILHRDRRAAAPRRLDRGRGDRRERRHRLHRPVVVPHQPVCCGPRSPRRC